jgi:Xaa-Pro aminopeptidase
VRYLTGVADATERIAFGYADGTAVLALPPGVAAPGTFSGRIDRDSDAVPAARIASLLADVCDGDRIATPRQLPHDAARYVQQAGFELTSTTAVADARATKTDPEVAAIVRAADAAMAGLDRARKRLAAATIADGSLELAGEPLTAGRLREEIDAAVALAGGQAAGNTRVVGGAETAVDTFAGAALPNDRSQGLPAAKPIQISLAPRDPAGYHASLARTIAVRAGGGWERRAHVACEAARRVGIDTVSADTTATRVAEELVAELGAFGFDPGREAGPAGTGLGLSTAEQPTLTGTTQLCDGMVLSLTPSLSTGDDLGVALADTVVVDGEEARLLTPCPTTMAPRAD